MPLDPQTHAFIKRLNGMHFVLTRNLTPVQARKRQRALMQLTDSGTREKVFRIENLTIPGPGENTPLRIYLPEGTGPFPILLYFHSGGGVIGDLDSEDGLCRSLTNQVGCIVVSVDYHLAPEYQFPVGQEECYAATCWVANHATQLNGIPSQIAVAGLSAGANLAAAVTLMARDRGTPTLIFQLLLAPITDFRLPLTPSFEQYAEGYLLTREDILWFMGHAMTREEDRLNPLASPYLASSLMGLPPALIITAEYDPLRDDGEHYGKRLQEAGVPTRISRREGAIHGFIVPNQLTAIIAESASALRSTFM